MISNAKARRPRYKGPVPEGHKYCPECAAVKPLGDFGKHPRGVSAYCKPCKVVRQRDTIARSAGKPPEESAGRFWQYVNKDGPNGCWQWTGSIRNDGYGQFWMGGRVRKAHHASMILQGVEVPTWPMVVDHKCKNKGCVNMEHLRVCHQSDNIGKYADRSKSREKLLAAWAKSGFKPGRQKGGGYFKKPE